MGGLYLMGHNVCPETVLRENGSKVITNLTIALLMKQNKNDLSANMHRLLILLLFPAFFSTAYGQSGNIRLEIKTLVDSMALENQFNASGIGPGGTRTAQWDRYITLKAIATHIELKHLVSHDHPVVRCYAFLAMAERHDSLVFPVLLEHLSDTARVVTVFGCILRFDFVADFFIDVVTPDYISLEAYKLDKNQKLILDSLLLFTPQLKLDAKSRTIRYLQPNPSYHQRLQEIAKVEKNPNAAIALARFQDENDIPLIQNFFKNDYTEYYAIYAVREFPHPLFYPTLKTIFNREWKEKGYSFQNLRILYQALAKYDTPETMKLFEKTLKIKNDYKYQKLNKYLLIAITSVRL